jgi:integrase
VLIRANKHGPDRHVPLHPTTVDALAEYEANPYRQAVSPSPDGPLFVTITGTAYQRQSVERHFQRIRAAAIAGLVLQGIGSAGPGVRPRPGGGSDGGPGGGAKLRCQAGNNAGLSAC